MKLPLIALSLVLSGSAFASSEFFYDLPVMDKLGSVQECVTQGKYTYLRLVHQVGTLKLSINSNSSAINSAKVVGDKLDVTPKETVWTFRDAAACQSFRQELLKKIGSAARRAE